jgi:hypothetical protein
MLTASSVGIHRMRRKFRVDVTYAPMEGAALGDKGSDAVAR